MITVRFDTSSFVRADEKTGDRRIEVLDEDLCQVAVASATSAVELDEPGAYAALLRLEDGRLVQRTFRVEPGQVEMVVNFRPSPSPSTGGSTRPPEPIACSARRSDSRFLSWMRRYRFYLGSLACLLMTGVLVYWLTGLESSGRAVQTSSHGPTENADPSRATRSADGPTYTEFNARINDLREVTSRQSGHVATRMGDRIPSSPIEPTLPPGLAPTPGSDLQFRPLPSSATRPLQERDWSGAAMVWLAAAAALSLAFVVLAWRVLARVRKSAPTVASAAAGTAANIAVAYHVGVELAFSEGGTSRQVGEAFQVVRDPKEHGLPRIEVVYPGKRTGIAVMLPLAPGGAALVEIRQGPYPHIVFQDAEMERMLFFRSRFQLDEASEIGASLIRSVAQRKQIDRPVSLATALYFMLRTGLLPLAEIVKPAQRLVDEHPWLPDAHVIGGEVAARQAFHRDALKHFLNLGGMGPPFGTAGVTYLNDRLGLYERYVERELAAPNLVAPLKELRPKMRLLAARMIATRPITTFVVGDEAEIVAAARSERASLDRGDDFTI